MAQISANEYKELCAQANDMVRKRNGENVGDGWIKIDSSPKTNSNFKAVLYQKGDQYAVCFVGTDKFSIKDHGANLKMGITGNSKQIQNAKEFAKKMMEKHGLSPQNTVSIGHSEGGTEATHVGLENGLKTITFNAYGVHKSKLPKDVDLNLVTNFRDPHDPVSKMHANVGTTYITPSTQSGFMSKTPFGSIQSHGINNMGDCDNAIPLQDYQKSHPWFLNKISDAEITRENIAQMDGGLFSIYEPEIDKRMLGNQIYSSTQLASSGSVYVKGYTREDGTKVSGYYRRAIQVQ